MSKKYTSLEYEIQVSEEEIWNNGKKILGVIANEEDKLPEDPIFVIEDNNRSDVDPMAFLPPNILLITSTSFKELLNENVEYEVMLWHELGHWYYQDEQVADDVYMSLRKECIENKKLMKDEQLADDYAIAKYGKSVFVKVLVGQKQRIMRNIKKLKDSKDKYLLGAREIQIRIDRVNKLK